MPAKKSARKGTAREERPGGAWLLPVVALAGLLLIVVWAVSRDETPGPSQAAVPAAEALPAAAPTQATPPELPLLDMPDDLPPLVANPAMSRPARVVAAVYEFAARHPEVLQYVPCYCGCELHGHGANDDCFVAARDPEGRVTWEPHGMT